MRKCLFLATLLLSSAPLSARPVDPAVARRIDRILSATPLIDGHNDLAEQLRAHDHGSVAGLASGTDTRKNPLMTDMVRLRSGHVGAQFWSVYIDAGVHGDQAIRETIEQIDTITRMVQAYPRDLELASTADDIVRIHKAGRIASLMGIEGGHQIGGSMAALRQFYRLGCRYMTLTHYDTTEWADSATDDPEHGGLTPFGVKVVREMNRIGMLVDLSHVSPDTMADALDASAAPVIFSHSNARVLDDNPRNIPDDILRRLAKNGGVAMVDFYPGHLTEAYRHWNADQSAEAARLKSLLTGQPDRREAAMKVWLDAHPAPAASVRDIADHIEHVARVAGHDHVGIGADFDGIEATPQGIGGVDGYPLVFAELIRRGWKDSDLARLAGGNLLRVLRAAEATARSMRDVPPSMEVLPPAAPADTAAQ